MKVNILLGMNNTENLSDEVSAYAAEQLQAGQILQVDSYETFNAEDGRPRLRTLRLQFTPAKSAESVQAENQRELPRHKVEDFLLDERVIYKPAHVVGLASGCESGVVAVKGTTGLHVRYASVTAFTAPTDLFKLSDLNQKELQYWSERQPMLIPIKKPLHLTTLLQRIASFARASNPVALTPREAEHVAKVLTAASIIQSCYAAGMHGTVQQHIKTLAAAVEEDLY